MNKVEAASKVRVSPLAYVVLAGIVGALIGVALIPTSAATGVIGTNEAVSVAIPVVRLLLDIAAVVTIGASVLPSLLGTDRPALSSRVMALARSVGVAGATVWAVCALVALVLQTAEYRPQARTIGFGDILGYVERVPAGKALLLVAALALTLAALHPVAGTRGERVPTQLRVGLGLLSLLPLPLTGHTSHAGYHAVKVISISLHVMSVVTWCGGLTAMIVLLTGNRALLACALPRFSKLASLCLGTSAVTGLINAGVQIALDPRVGLWAGLFGTAYGQLTLLKVLCLAVIGMLGAKLRWRLLPQVIRQQSTALAGWASVELAVMGLAFGLAAALSRAPVS